MFKLYGTEHNKKRHELMVAASGVNGVAWGGDEFDDDAMTSASPSTSQKVLAPLLL